MKTLKAVAITLFALNLLGMIIFEQYREGFTLSMCLFGMAILLADLASGESGEGKEFEEY